MSDLPAPVRKGVERALAGLGHACTITRATPVSGGCINHGARLDASTGSSFFLKWNPSAPPRMFEAEADGLLALAASCPLRIPKPVARGGGAGVPGWLLLEYVQAGRPTPEFGETLGRGLATLHAAEGPEEFGWPRHNWIGSLTQKNARCASWADFWSEHRLRPQLDTARQSGRFSGTAGAVLDAVLERVPTALADVDLSTPSVLHGDLWNGNTYADETGAPVLIDPAVYAGHGEVDLAMTELFGGFGPRFYAAYHEVVPITEAYEAYRRDLYQLYYLLVHVNLFGAGYVQGTLDAARRVVDALQ